MPLQQKTALQLFRKQTHVAERGFGIWLLLALIPWLVALTAQPSFAQIQNESARLSGEPGNNNFGYSVAISGTTAVVGSGYGPGDLTPSAQVFEKDSATNEWVRQPAFTTTDLANYDGFGISTAVSGGTVIVGAPYGNNDTGAAYVYGRNPTTGVWTQQQRLTANDAITHGGFGSAVSLSGDIAIVGAWTADLFGVQSGSAYIFYRSPSTGVWLQQQRLIPSDAHPLAGGFGAAVALSGDTAIVGTGAYGNQSAYIFVRNASGSWVEQQKLVPADARGGRFGVSVSLDGDTAIIGAEDDSDLGEQSGAAYFFTRNAGVWTQRQKVTASNGSAYRKFGRSVSIEGNSAIVGASGPPNGMESGAAFVFTLDSSGTWMESQKYVSSDGGPNDAFGYSIAQSGDTALVGAPYKGSYLSYGAAYVFSPGERQPTIISPPSGATLSRGPTEIFSWHPGSASVTQYWLYAGSSVGGAQYDDSGPLGTITGNTLTGLPTDGSTVHVRLWYQLAGSSTWLFTDATYTACTGCGSSPDITVPLPGNTLTGASQTFFWADNGASATAFWLYVGSTVGGAEYYDSGNLGPAAFTATVDTLPTDGSPVHLRLWYTVGASAWHYVDASYLAATLPIPEIAEPASDATLSGTAVPFSWTDNGSGATNWWLYVGDTPGGDQFFNSGELGSANSVTATGLPSDGSPVHARLWYQLPGSTAWRHVDSSYTATGTRPAQITSPAPGSTISGSSATVSWTDNGAGVQQWWLYVGSAPGTKDYHDSGSLGTSIGYTASGLPQDGSTVYMSLWYRIGSIWQYEAFPYTSQ